MSGLARTNNGTWFYCAICGGAAHDPFACWPWADEAERQARYQLPYFRDRMKLHNVTEADITALQKPEGRAIMEYQRERP